MAMITLSKKLVDNWRKTALEFTRPIRDSDPEQRILRTIHRERPAIKKLWLTFNKEREDIDYQLLNKKPELAAYLLGFHLPNMARMKLLLQRLSSRHANFPKLFKKFPKIHITDLGAGTGAASLCFADWLAHHDINHAEFELYDTSASALAAAAKGFQEFPIKYPYKTRGLRIENFLPRQASKDQLNVFIMSYVWNELYRNPTAQKKLVQNFTQLSTDHPVLLLFSEPANEEHAKYMVQVRQQLCDAGLIALYPCSHSQPCPMLKSDRDWCFSEGHWQPPKEVELVDRLLELDRQHLSCSSYAFVSPLTLEKSELPSPNNAPIVVGRPRQKESQAFDYLSCSSDGLEKSPSHSHGPGRRLRGEPLTTLDRK